MRLALFLFLVWPTLSWACLFPPEHLFDPPYLLVASTEVIVLAKTTKYEAIEGANTAFFEFETVELLKGDAQPLVRLEGYVAGQIQESAGDFDAHHSAKFWAYEHGNSIVGCDALGVFEIGETYLIFLRPKSHVRAYENVRESDDLWLEVVKLLIED